MSNSLEKELERLCQQRDELNRKIRRKQALKAKKQQELDDKKHQIIGRVVSRYLADGQNLVLNTERDLESLLEKALTDKKERSLFGWDSASESPGSKNNQSEVEKVADKNNQSDTDKTDSPLQEAKTQTTKRKTRSRKSSTKSTRSKSDSPKQPPTGETEGMTVTGVKRLNESRTQDELAGEFNE